MAKKKVTKLKLSKFPKWAWWPLWFVGILASLWLIGYGALQIWSSTWQSFSKYGVSFNYPKQWQIFDLYTFNNKQESRQDLLMITDDRNVKLPGADGFEGTSNRVVISRFQKNNSNIALSMYVAKDRINWPGKLFALSNLSIDGFKSIRDVRIYGNDWISYTWIDTDNYLYKIVATSTNGDKYTPVKSVWFNIVINRIILSAHFR